MLRRLVILGGLLTATAWGIGPQWAVAQAMLADDIIILSKGQREQEKARTRDSESRSLRKDQNNGVGWFRKMRCGKTCRRLRCLLNCLARWSSHPPRSLGRAKEKQLLSRDSSSFDAALHAMVANMGFCRGYVTRVPVFEPHRCVGCVCRAYGACDYFANRYPRLPPWASSMPRLRRWFGWRINSLRGVWFLLWSFLRLCSRSACREVRSLPLEMARMWA